MRNGRGLHSSCTARRSLRRSGAMYILWRRLILFDSNAPARTDAAHSYFGVIIFFFMYMGNINGSTMPPEQDV